MRSLKLGPECLKWASEKPGSQGDGQNAKLAPNARNWLWLRI
ncbi:unnamed protein product [Camellia sinensis]